MAQVIVEAAARLQHPLLLTRSHAHLVGGPAERQFSQEHVPAAVLRGRHVGARSKWRRRALEDLRPQPYRGVQPRRHVEALLVRDGHGAPVVHYRLVARLLAEVRHVAVLRHVQCHTKRLVVATRVHVALHRACVARRVEDEAEAEPRVADRKEVGWMAGVAAERAVNQHVRQIVGEALQRGALQAVEEEQEVVQPQGVRPPVLESWKQRVVGFLGRQICESLQVGINGCIGFDEGQEPVVPQRVEIADCDGREEHGAGVRDAGGGDGGMAAQFDVNAVQLPSTKPAGSR